MSDIAKILKEMKVNPKGIRFAELRKVCEHYFGEARQSGSGHRRLLAEYLAQNNSEIKIKHL